MLRRAAAAAIDRGSPGTAITYLERCLAEPPAEPDRLAVLEDLGQTAITVDAARAVTYLRAAVKIARSPGQRARLVQALGHALFVNGRHREATVLYERAPAPDGEREADSRGRPQAHLINVASHDPIRNQQVDDLVGTLRRGTSAGGAWLRIRDGLIAFRASSRSPGWRPTG